MIPSDPHAPTFPCGCQSQSWGSHFNWFNVWLWVQEISSSQEIRCSMMTMTVWWYFWHHQRSSEAWALHIEEKVLMHPAGWHAAGFNNTKYKMPMTSINEQFTFISLGPRWVKTHSFHSLPHDEVSVLPVQSFENHQMPSQWIRLSHKTGHQFDPNDWE